MILKVHMYIQNTCRKLSQIHIRKLRITSKTGYHSKTINASVLNNNTTTLNVQLVPINSVSVQEINNNKKVNRSFDILGRKNNKSLIKFEIQIMGVKQKI